MEPRIAGRRARIESVHFPPHTAQVLCRLACRRPGPSHSMPCIGYTYLGDSVLRVVCHQRGEGRVIVSSHNCN